MTELLFILLVFSPLAGAAIIAGLNKGNREWSKRISFVVSCIPFIISLVLYYQYVGVVDAGGVRADGYVLFFNYNWLSTGGIDIDFSMGLDGISIYLVMLTTIIFPLSIYFSWGSIDHHPRAYYSLMLLLEVGVTGFFVSLDMLLFYVFFEMVLIPMYFLIGIWGGKDRVYASLKFFLYTLVGSLLMLVGIIYLAAHVNLTDPALLAARPDLEGIVFTTEYLLIVEYADITPTAEVWLFLAFALAFAVKVPLFPLHTWLPDAHVQAPTAGSVILAGVLLKMGSYGLVRFCLPLFPTASVMAAPYMSILAVIGIVYGAMAAMVQTDIKKLVAYSSVSHLGFIVLGTFAFTTEALTGAVIQMVNHGVATGGLFLLVGMIYDRRHTREIKDFQGIATQMPRFALIFLITVLASVGLPGLNGFVGEFLILVGSFKSDMISPVFPIVSATGVIIAAVYLLWMFRRVMFGPLDKDENRQLQDLDRREIAVMVPLIILMLWMGIYARPFLRQIDLSTQPLVERVLERSGHHSGHDHEHNAEVEVEVPRAEEFRP
ncbi:MAG: NADH-quinone oxidoreductase subunit M [Bacteroidia bacterium]